MSICNGQTKENMTVIESNKKFQQRVLPLIEKGFRFYEIQYSYSFMNTYLFVEQKGSFT